MLRSINIVERDVFDEQLKTVVVPDSVSTEVFPDETASGKEIAYREIFNAGGNVAYYAFGRTCDTASNFNAWLVPGQMLEIATLQRVSIFSVGGTTIARTSLIRRDMEVPSANIKYPA